jgi:hypothetical protein
METVPAFTLQEGYGQRLHLATQPMKIKFTEELLTPEGNLLHQH